MTSIVIADPLPPGEWDRYPFSLAEDAYWDGWSQRLGGSPHTYPRQLNPGELTAWTRGHAAAHRATPCVRVAVEPLQPAAATAPPLHTLPAASSRQRAKAAKLEVPADAPTIVGDRPRIVRRNPRPPEDQAARLVELLELAPPPPPVAPFFDGTQICAQVDPELFFPEKGASSAAAKQLCTTCPFQEACLAYALHERIGGMPITGIWGGTSSLDRSRLRAAAEGADLADVDLLDGEVA